MPKFELSILHGLFQLSSIIHILLLGIDILEIHTQVI